MFFEQDVEAEDHELTTVTLRLAEEPGAPVQRTRGCRACEISTNEPLPLGLLFFPLVAIARRRLRRV